MNQRHGLITMKGNPLTLIGNELNTGNMAPDFTAVGNDLKPVKLSSFAGKTVIISAVPSLDTPVCDLETRRFNEEAKQLFSDVVILTISMDLPFAQKRWCGANGIERVITLSDYRESEFGVSYGVLINELKLLARAIFIVDKRGFIRYRQLVSEVTNEPDYADVLNALKEIA